MNGNSCLQVDLLFLFIQMLNISSKQWLYVTRFDNYFDLNEHWVFKLINKN